MLKMDIDMIITRHRNESYHFDAMYCIATRTITNVSTPMFMNVVYTYTFHGDHNDRFTMNTYRLQGGEKCAEHRGFRK